MPNMFCSFFLAFFSLDIKHISSKEYVLELSLMACEHEAIHWQEESTDTSLNTS